MRRIILPLAAALALQAGVTPAGAQEASDPMAVQSAYQSSMTEQAALALAGPDGGLVPLELTTDPMAAGDALAVNLSRTLQVIRQIQRGCRSYCFGETMEQKAWQQALTLQDAGAESADGSAAALNLSETIQTIEQIQYGCRIFCYGVSMSQSAWQLAGTGQVAAAAGSTAALAANLSLTRQVITQIQKACMKHCLGVELSQVAWQSAVTAQNGLAVADGSEQAEEVLAAAALGAEGTEGTVAPATVAANLSGTLQALEQIQADCRRFCFYGVSLTDAEWWARTGLLPVDVDPSEELGLLAGDDEEPEAAEPSDPALEATAGAAEVTAAAHPDASLLPAPPASGAEVLDLATTEQSVAQSQAP